MPCSCCHHALRVVPGIAVELLARFQHAVDDVVPAAALGIHAVPGHQVGDLARQVDIVVLALQGVHADEVPGDLEIVSHDGAVLLPAPGLILFPVLEELFLDEGALVVIGEVFDNGVERVFEKVGSALLAGGEIKVDEIGRRVVAHGIPVLAGPVMAEALDMGRKGDRIDMAEIAAQIRLVLEEAVEQRNRGFGIGQNGRVAGRAIGLNGAGKRIDLLVAGNGVEIVSELGREDLALAAVVLDVDRVVPENDAFALVLKTQMLAQIFGAGLGGFEEPVLRPVMRKAEAKP